jgi:hypothetical protein
MGRNLVPIWIDTFFFYNGKKIVVSNIQHPYGKLSLLFRIGCHDLHVDMKTKNRNMLPKMRLRQRSIDNVFSSSLGNNKQDLSKIPTKDHGFPTKDLFSCLCIIQLHQITQGPINSFKSSTMHHRCFIPNDHISFTHQLGTFIYCVMLQVDSSCRLIGILNLEWAILPPRNNKDAIRDEATVSTILPCRHRRDKNVVQTNVLLVPPLPYTNNNLPSLFVTSFKIVSYALC